MIRLSRGTKSHLAGDVRTTALAGIDLEIRAGEYVAIVGPSGCGKSSLLSVLGLLAPLDDGHYHFDGQSVAGWNEHRLNDLRRGRIGFIFQSFNLIEELTVRENVELPLEYLPEPLPATQRRARADALLAKLGVSHRADHRPSQLSGGQQQRVAIARALVVEPALLLADEPTGNLDTAHGDEVMGLLRQIHAEGTTIVMVTHSPAHAAQAQRRLQMLDGRIVADDLRAAA